MFVSTGCAAILNQNGRRLVIGSPSGIKNVTENGESLETTPDPTKEGAVVVSLDRSKEHVLIVTTGSGVTTLEPQRQFIASYACLDGFLTLGVGEIVDEATDDWDSWRTMTAP